MPTLSVLRQSLAGRSPVDGSVLFGVDAARHLASAIVQLRYAPGQLLTERQVMADLGISRAALREATIHLGDLGLMETLPRKGLLVSPIGALDVPRIYDARLAIETQLARFAAIRANSAALETLQSHVREEIPSADASDQERTRRFVEHDHSVHLAVASIAGNDLLEDALTRILLLNQRLWYWVYDQVGPRTQMMFTHDGIVEAIATGDPDAAEAAVGEHLAQARRALTDVFMHTLSGGQR